MIQLRKLRLREASAPAGYHIAGEGWDGFIARQNPRID
jgi:hypothetical protein